MDPNGSLTKAPREPLRIRASTAPQLKPDRKEDRGRGVQGVQLRDSSLRRITRAYVRQAVHAFLKRRDGFRFPAAISVARIGSHPCRFFRKGPRRTSNKHFGPRTLPAAILNRRCLSISDYRFVPSSAS